MFYGAIDLHTKHSEIRVIDAAGAVQWSRRIVTTREGLVAAFAPFTPLRILVEAGTESEWVAQALEEAGHAVIVADPNHAPMYGTRRRAVKTDQRDVVALAEANRRGWFKPTYRVSAAQRAVRQQLRVRRQLVQARSGLIAVAKALVRQAGGRLRGGSAEALPARIAGLALPAALAETLAPVAATIAQLSATVATVDAQLAAGAAGDPILRRLQTVPGVGPVVAQSFRAFVDDVGRFANASEVSAAIGLVPREDSSAERRHRGHITKAGPRELRSLLVQAAWVCWRSAKAPTLQQWVAGLAARRGTRIAVVALARRLSRILYAIWRDQSTFAGRPLAA
jgi:transposase